MNILNSFKTCINPDHISPTNSIESIDQEHKFLAANIDEQGNDISRGEIQIKNDAIVYVLTGKNPISWPVDCIRRYGSIENGQKLIFEAGRKCGTGQGIYAFRCYRAQECVVRLNELIDSKEPLIKSQQNGCSKLKKPTTTRARHMKDASTSTGGDQQQSTSSEASMITDRSIKPLSYVLIDFETTKALNESAQDHAAMRVK